MTKTDDRPLLLDLFCGAGGAAMGYHRAGFDVVGVDIKPQPHYPFRFQQGDALEVMWDILARPERFDAIHASPPCQAYSVTRHSHKNRLGHPELLAPTRDMLRSTGLPYIIENVVGAPITTQASFEVQDASAVLLCGTMFELHAPDPKSGLDLWLSRHRWFESNRVLRTAGICSCRGRDIGGVYGGGSHDNNRAKHVRRGGYTPDTAWARNALDIEWMPYVSMTQAIPAAYTEFIGAQLLEHLERVA